MKVNLAVVHPLVLLSVVDHFNRHNLKKRNKNRVIGVLLGETNGSTVEVTNSYAIPFDQQEKQSNVWFVDHNYHERMFKMFKKINAREKFVGWYSTGNRFLPQDIQINEVFRKYASKQVFLTIDVQSLDSSGLPTQGYVTQQELNQDGEIIRTFSHIETTVQAFEPQEIGVQHLLRELKDISDNSMAQHIGDRVKSVQILASKLKSISEYLQKVVEGKLKPNSKIVYILQDILNLLPDINTPEVIRAFTVKSNDQMFGVLVGAMSQAVLSLHSVSSAQLQSVLETEEEKQKQKEKQKEKEKEKQKEKEGETKKQVK